ncbi:hypothetical protein [Streptomyces sp. NPDC046925]|uniref:hypothetical protein n=1 Tax=Streptomyces sp. NPDC046925 TaxID=3155375 RepID=UPI00341005E7
MDEVRQIVVHPAAWDALEAWLRSRGLVLVNIDALLSGDDIPTYVMQLARPGREDNGHAPR